MNKELEVYIEEYRKLKKNREIINSIDSDFFFDFADTMLNYIENSIPKKVIEEKYLKMEKEYGRKVYDKKYDRYEVKVEEMYKAQVYKELLEVE